MPSKAKLTEKANALGVPLVEGMTNKQIAAAIKAHQSGARSPDPGAAGERGKHLVEFKRDLRGAPCRCRGQRVWLTHGQIERQGLTSDDYTVIK